MAIDISAVLNLATTQKLSATLISLSSERKVQVQLLELSPDHLELGIPEHTLLDVFTLVSVSFRMGPRTYTFLASVLDLEDQKLHLGIPREMVSADSRQSARHEVTLPVEVELLGAHFAAKPRLVDLALCGMKVAVEKSSGLRVGERIPVILTFEDIRVELTGELRHNKENQLGFFFPETIRKGRVDPPKELARLVKRVAG